MDNNTEKKEALSKLSPEEISEMRLIEKKNYIKRKKGEALYDFMNYLGWLISSLFFFVLHWNLYKKHKDK
jgi:hypothetical protein